MVQIAVGCVPSAGYLYDLCGWFSGDGSPPFYRRFSASLQFDARNVLSLRTSINNGPRQNSRKMGLGVILVMGLLLTLMPSKVAGQDQGGVERTPVRAADADVDVDLENTGLVPDRPTVRPTRTDTPPDIDGRLDDEVWKTAALITEFVQQSPLDGAPATEETEVYVAYDADNLYFAFYAHYEDPSIMRANRVDRDRAAADDLLTVYFDTFMDQQGGYDFDVNAYGVQGDGTISGGGFFGGRGGGGGGGGGSRGRIPFADRSWNALFETGAQIVEDGFTAEMAIPFKSLRYPSRARDEAHRWGFQIVREVKDKDQENQVWAPMSRDESSFLAQMGVLDGMVNLSTSRNIEVLPTFTTIRYGAIDPSVPAFVHLDTDPDAGVNVKYGVTSNLTADFTVNPEFLTNRVGPHPDRGEPTFSHTLPRAPALFCRGGGDFQLHWAGDAGPHSHDGRSGLWREADGQGG